MAEGQEPVVQFTVKELVARVDGKVDIVLARLDTKADVVVVTALDERLTAVEDDLKVAAAVNRSLRRLVFVGVPGFTAFVGAVVGLASRFIR